MKVPVIRKIIKNQERFIERLLPAKGKIFVKTGDKVEMFDKLGECQVSMKAVSVRYRGSLEVEEGESIEQGDTLASSKKIFNLKKRKTVSPIHGVVDGIDRKEKVMYIKSFPVEFELISGFGGIVEKVIKDRSVLLKSRVANIKGVCGTSFEVGGEIRVIKKLNMDNLSAKLEGQIIAGEGYLDLSMLKKASALEIEGIITGGIDYQTLQGAEISELALLSISGFGKIPILKNVLDYLRGIEGRFVILRGETKELLIPESGERITDNRNLKTESMGKDVPKSDSLISDFRSLKIGDTVQVFTHPFFGWVGEIMEVYNNKVEFESKKIGYEAKVRLAKNNEEIDVALKNMGVLE